MDQEDVRKALTAMRERLGWSAGYLASMTKTADKRALGQGAVYDIESGRTKDPGVGTVIRLVLAMNVSVSQFFAKLEAGEGKPLNLVGPNGMVEPPSGEGREAHSPNTTNVPDAKEASDEIGVVDLSTAREIRALKKEVAGVRKLLADNSVHVQSLQQFVTRLLPQSAHQAGNRPAPGGDPGTPGDVPPRATGTDPHPTERRKGDRRDGAGHQQSSRLKK